jgi:hypothetical protein
MDRDNKQKSSPGNDSKLNREKNKVTGVRTSDQLPERKHSDEETDNNRGAE